MYLQHLATFLYIQAVLFSTHLKYPGKEGLNIFSKYYQKHILPGGGGGFLENICTGMLKVNFRMLTISIPVYCKKQTKKKNTRSLYLTCMTKPTNLYTIFTEMMTHYYHFHQQNSPSSYHHRNKGSLIYLEQFQNHPIGIPKLMKMHLKIFEHPRTPCFRESPPGIFYGQL